MNNNPTTATYEGQLAARVADVLPDTDTAERLELLGVMDPDDMRTSLAWLVSHAPKLFDFAFVRDLAMVERLMARLNEGQATTRSRTARRAGARSASSTRTVTPGCTTAARAPPPAPSSCSTPGTSR